MLNDPLLCPDYQYIRYDTVIYDVRLDSLLVDYQAVLVQAQASEKRRKLTFSRALILAFVDLARNGVSRTGDAVAQAVLARNVALGLLLARLFLRLSGLSRR